MHLKIEANKDLQLLNTFGLKVFAKYYCEVAQISDLNYLSEYIKSHKLKYLILGGGSNLLFIDDFNGIVVKNALKGIEFKDLGEEIFVNCASGENWHEFVLATLEQKLSGIENLSLIPGTTGAAPIQNIGAYGVELKDSLLSVEAFNMETQKIEVFSNEMCRFGYRESIFKTTHPGKYFITNVSFHLSRDFYKVNASYGAIGKILEDNRIIHPNAKDISEAVIQIRQQKLPDPKILGNAGSFFKNPIIPEAIFSEIQNKHPDIHFFQDRPGKIKIPAAWLIEKAGWKGVRAGNVGMHKDQALVLVNYGGATSEELLNHVRKVQNSVFETFGIELTPEVNLI